MNTEICLQAIKRIARGEEHATALRLCPFNVLNLQIVC